MPGQTNTVLLEEVAKDIIQKYGALSTDDIRHAFNRLDLTKTDWRRLTKREILFPIVEWVQSRAKINVEFDKVQKEKDKELERIEKEDVFEKESIEIYKECLKTGVWTGSIYNSNSIAKKYLAEKMDQELKDRLWIESKEIMGKISVTIEAKNSRKEMLTSDELLFTNTKIQALRFFSHLIVKNSISLKIEI